MAAVSWIVGRGESPYPAAGSSSQFGFPYGPLLYSTNASTMRLLGPSLLSSKSAGVLAALLSLTFVAVACRARQGLVWAAVATSALGYLTFGSASFWVRSEPLLLALIALGLLGLTGPSWLAVLLGGIAVGFGMATKASALGYVLPMLVMMWARWSWRMPLAALLIGVATFLLAFLGRSFTLLDYAYWVGTATKHGIRWRSLPTSLEWAIALSLPSAVALWRARERRGSLPSLNYAGRVALIACLLGTLVLAAKQGTGAHHFLPFVPTLIFLEGGGPLAESSDVYYRRVILGLGLAALIIGVLQQTYWIAAVVRGADKEAVVELERLEHSYTGPLAVGYSRNYRLSFLRPLPVFAGEPYQIDAVALMDAEVAGTSMPRTVVSSLRSCTMKVWLIPAGGEPFDLRSAYDPSVRVFDNEFVSAFHESYELREKGRYFDAWLCRD